jgi:hypothetical protein
MRESGEALKLCSSQLLPVLSVAAAALLLLLGVNSAGAAAMGAALAVTASTAACCCCCGMRSVMTVPRGTLSTKLTVPPMRSASVLCALKMQ